MNQLILFVNSFLSYLLVFAIVVVLLIVGCTIGIKWRKSKDAKAALEVSATEDSTEL
ncbi:MAG: hypothetical protein RRX92_04515 [Lachnospiraceae bacterium]